MHDVNFTGALNLASKLAILNDTSYSSNNGTQSSNRSWPLPSRFLPTLTLSPPRWDVQCMAAAQDVYNILVGKPHGKRPPWRPRHWWEDETRIDLREI